MSGGEAANQESDVASVAKRPSAAVMRYHKVRDGTDGGGRRRDLAGGQSVGLNSVCDYTDYSTLTVYIQYYHLHSTI